MTMQSGGLPVSNGAQEHLSSLLPRLLPTEHVREMESFIVSGKHSDYQLKNNFSETRLTLQQPDQTES